MFGMEVDFDDLFGLAEKYGYVCIADVIVDRILSLVETCKKHKSLPSDVQKLLAFLEDVL